MTYNYVIPSKDQEVSTYAELQNPLQKLNQVFYLDAHIVDICVMLEDLS